MAKMNFSFCSVIYFAAVLAATSSAPHGNFGHAFHSLLEGHHSKNHGFGFNGFGGHNAHNPLEDGLYNLGHLNRHHHHHRHHYRNNENDCDNCGDDGSQIPGRNFHHFFKGHGDLGGFRGIETGGKSFDDVKTFIPVTSAFGIPGTESAGSAADLSSLTAALDPSGILQKGSAQIEDTLKGFGTGGLPFLGKDNPVSSLPSLPGFDGLAGNSQDVGVSLFESVPGANAGPQPPQVSGSEVDPIGETLPLVSDSLNQAFSGSQAGGSFSSSSDSNNGSSSAGVGGDEGNSGNSGSGSSGSETDTDSLSSASSSSEEISISISKNSESSSSESLSSESSSDR